MLVQMTTERTIQPQTEPCASAVHTFSGESIRLYAPKGGQLFTKQSYSQKDLDLSHLIAQMTTWTVKYLSRFTYKNKTSHINMSFSK